jgi:hypothetical protein
MVYGDPRSYQKRGLQEHKTWGRRGCPASDHSCNDVSRLLSPPIMLSFFKRRIYSVLNSQKTEIYGLRYAKRQLEATRPAHRRFTTFLASGSLRRRYTMPSHATLRHLHVRAISYSSIPRFVARAFRVPIAGATVGVGGFGYANYKFEGRLCDLPL